MATERDVIIETFEDEILLPEERIEKVKFNLPVSKVTKVVEGYLQSIQESGNEDDEEARADLYSSIESFMSQSQQSGDADDFHNFAVALAKKNEMALACQVLENGLKLFPKNVDLLADYLQYGIDCEKLDECKKYYKSLLKIPRRRWTWRGFAFLIDYLKFLVENSDSEKEIDTKEKEMLEVVSEFKKYYPYSEETYRVEASVYKCLNMQDEELAVLQKALESVEVAPKCALRCADILFERGRYEEATEKIKRGISDATQAQKAVSEGYIYYLSALCKIATAQKSGNIGNLSRDNVVEIYSDFDIALKDLRDSSYVEVIKTKTNTLVNKTGVEVPPEYDLLCDCIGD